MDFHRCISLVNLLCLWQMPNLESWALNILSNKLLDLLVRMARGEQYCISLHVEIVLVNSEHWWTFGWVFQDCKHYCNLFDIILAWGLIVLVVLCSCIIFVRWLMSLSIYARIAYDSLNSRYYYKLISYAYWNHSFWKLIGVKIVLWCQLLKINHLLCCFDVKSCICFEFVKINLFLFYDGVISKRWYPFPSWCLSSQKLKWTIYLKKICAFFEPYLGL